MAAQGVSVGIVTYYGGDMPNLIGELDMLDRRNMLPYEYTTTNLLLYRGDGTKSIRYIKKTPAFRYEDICEVFRDCGFFKICPMDYEVEPGLVQCLYAEGKTVFVTLAGTAARPAACAAPWRRTAAAKLFPLSAKTAQ
jgi:hypothetical protein